MAKQKGYVKFKGTLGGLTYYEANRQGLVRTKGGVDKSRIEKDPAFRRTRENMSEFGGAAKVGKALRSGFANVIKNMSDATVVARITGMMKRINSLGPGIRGKRAFEILNNKIIVEGFEFNKAKTLSAIFYPEYAPPSLDANRSIATLTIPDFNTQDYINFPEGATHFKLLLVTTVLSDYTFSNGIGQFEPVNNNENETNGIDFSAEIPLTGMVGADTILSVDLGFGAALPATVGVVIGIGIVFYQEINTQFYELASDNAMKIAVVG